MRESFGDWDLCALRGSRCYALMIILTKCGRFYSRLDFNHNFGPPEVRFYQRFSVECDIEVLWTAVDDEPISRETLAVWEKEFKELVSEVPFLESILLPGGQKPLSIHRKLGAKESDKSGTYAAEETEMEVSDYVQACIDSGICASRGSRCYDPDDPDIFERYFGRKPTHQELGQIETEGGFSYW